MRARDLFSALRDVVYALLAVRFVELQPRYIPVRVLRPERRPPRR